MQSSAPEMTIKVSIETRYTKNDKTPIKYKKWLQINVNKL